jgi:hypothetical protein
MQKYSKLKAATAGIIRRRQEIEERLDKEQKLLVTLPSLEITQTGDGVSWQGRRRVA